MIATPHILTGALIASKVHNLPLALILAFASHYLLDSLPHWEYKLKDMNRGKWKEGWKDLLVVFLDAMVGTIFVYLLSDNFFIAIIGSFLAGLPDLIMIVNIKLKSKILSYTEIFHSGVHFLKNKIPKIWGKIVEATVTAIVILLFLLL